MKTDYKIVQHFSCCRNAEFLQQENFPLVKVLWILGASGFLEISRPLDSWYRWRGDKVFYRNLP